MRLFRSSFSSNGERSDGAKERSLLYLNVYDLTHMNDYLYWFGLGIFHSGIEVHGMEYGFGAHDYPSSGVFQVEPRSCPGFIFRRSILLGSTDISRSEFKLFLEELASKYHGDTYHLIAKNCNHFTDEVCLHLTRRHIPGWVNRLARLGSFFNCLLPQQLQVAAVRQIPNRPSYSDEDSDSLSCASIMDCQDDDEERPDHQLLSPVHPDVFFVKQSPILSTH